MKSFTALSIFTLAILSSCNSEEQSSSTEEKKSNDVEIIVKDSTYIPDDMQNESDSDTITVHYNLPENYETTILEENGDWFTLKVDFTEEVTYTDSADITYEVIYPVGTFKMTEPAKYEPSYLNNEIMCSTIIGKDYFQEMEIAAEGKSIYLNEMFFANNKLSDYDHDFDGENFYLNYKYYCCDIYECGIMIRYIINIHDQTSEVIVSDFNESPML